MVSKENVINDINFRKICLSYGADWNKATFFDNMIILHTIKNNIFVLLDSDYNTIGIYKKIDELNKMMTIPERLMLYRRMYMKNVDMLPYPFNKISLQQLCRLAKRIDTHDINHGHDTDIIVNGQAVNDEKDSDYYLVLSYIKFLGDQVEDYNRNLFQMRMMGFKYPNVYTYIRKLVNNINGCVNFYADHDKKILPIDIVNRLGQNRENAYLYDSELSAIIELINKDRYLNRNNNMSETNDGLDDVVKRLTKLLEVSDEELEMVNEDIIESFEFSEINLESFLSDNKVFRK